MKHRHALHAGLALAAVAGAVLARLALDPWLGDNHPVILVYAAVAFVLWSSGWPLATLTALVGYGVSYVLFIEPRGTAAFGASSQWLGTLLYLFTCAVIIGLGAALRRANARAHAVRADLQREIAERRRTEDALRASEARFRVFMDNSPANAFVKDGDGRYLYMNRKMQGRFGYDTRVWLGCTDADLLGEENGARYRANDRTVLERGTTAEFEEQLDDGSGTHSYLSFKFPLTGRDGAPLVGGMAFDITARKKMEEALRRRSEEFQTVLDRMPSPIFIAHDPACRVITGNRIAQALCGVSTFTNLSQRPDGEHTFVPRFFDATGRELAADQLPIFRAAATGKPTAPAELQLRFDDGRELWLQGSAAPLFEAPGQVRGVLALFADVTERKRAEQRVRADLAAMTRLHDLATRCAESGEHGDGGDTRACLEALLDAAIDFTGATRGTLRLIDPENDALELVAQRGFDTEFLRYFATIQGAIAGPAALALKAQCRVVVEDVAASELFANHAARQALLDEGVRAMQSTPLVTGAGKLVGVIATHFDRPQQPDEAALRLMDLLARQTADFLERQNAEDELLRLNDTLRRSDRRKDEFIATLAHELRNPLAPIFNAVQILKHKPPGDDAAGVHSVIERQAAQMARLLDDLLDVSRISRNRVELRRERLPLSAVIGSAAETSRPLIAAGGHRLDLDLPAEPLFVDADPVRLGQVFSNLLNNAARYSDAGGHIRVTARRSGGEVTIVVADTGHGIDAATLPRIFEMFAQGEHHDTLAPAGLGVGLSLAKGLVELHGGSIEARSEGRGRGCEFIVRLPVVSPIVPRAKHADDGPGVAAPDNLRILIADDLRDGAESLATLLRMSGHDVQTAYDGDIAIAAAERFRPDVVLLDIGMPKRNGYEVCRHLRAQPWGDAMCIVAVTGWCQEEDRNRSALTGFDQHLVKPVAFDALTSVLAQHAAPRRETQVSH